MADFNLKVFINNFLQSRLIKKYLEQNKKLPPVDFFLFI